VSKATQSFWQNAMGGKSVQLLYNGMPLDKFGNLVADKKSILPNANEHGLLVGMIGRVQPWKGQHYFLEIIQQYLQQHSEDQSTQFILAGDPFPGYEQLAIELVLDIKRRNLSDRVFYLGYRADIPQILASLDLLVLPSTSPDPLPTVVLEAMAAGKPVLATAQGGALEMIIENQTGKFMPIANAQQASVILADLLSDATTLNEMGKAGRSRVEKEFSPAAFANNWHKLCS
jgi:glycosyltransferase involved in cell wall biosynthesis